MNPLAIFLKLLPLLKGVDWASLITKESAKTLAIVFLLGAFLYSYYAAYQRGIEVGTLRTATIAKDRQIDDLIVSAAADAAYLEDMRVSKERSDALYLELKSKYNVLQKNLLDRTETIRVLQRTPGTADYDLLNQKLTPKVIDIVNGSAPADGLRK